VDGTEHDPAVNGRIPIVVRRARVGTSGVTSSRERAEQLSAGHCSGWDSSLSGSVSLTLVPFAPPELPGFNATMEPLTPRRRFFVSTLRLASPCGIAVTDNERRSVRRGLFASWIKPSGRSGSNHPSSSGSRSLRCAFRLNHGSRFQPRPSRDVTNCGIPGFAFG